MIADRARVAVLTEVALPTVLDVHGDPPDVLPRHLWRTRDGRPLDDDQVDAVLEATSADLRAVMAHHRGALAMEDARTAWAAEFYALVGRYAGPDETVEVALAAMPAEVRRRAYDLADLAGLADEDQPNNNSKDER